jgi:hypothetical protein
VPRRSRTCATSGRSATPMAAITSAYSHDFSETTMAAQVASAAVSRSGAPTMRASFTPRSRFLTMSTFHDLWRERSAGSIPACGVTPLLRFSELPVSALRAVDHRLPSHLVGEQGPPRRAGPRTGRRTQPALSDRVVSGVGCRAAVALPCPPAHPSPHPRQTARQ